MLWVWITLSVLLLTVFFAVVVPASVFYAAIVRKPINHKSGPVWLVGPRWGEHNKILAEKKQWLINRNGETLFITANDGIILNGTYYTADTQTDKVIIVCHGYMGFGLKDFAAIAAFYIQKGYNVLMVDLRAHGKSKGKFIGFGCLDRYDLLKWIDLIDTKFNHQCHIFLHGISMGGATVLMTNEFKLPKSVKGTIADCAFTSPHSQFTYMFKEVFHFPVFPILSVENHICRTIAGYGFKDGNTLKAMEETKLPVLFIHGDEDKFVPTCMSLENYQACAGEKTLLIVKGAAHGESYYMETERYEQAVEAFIEAHVR